MNIPLDELVKAANQYGKKRNSGEFLLVLFFVLVLSGIYLFYFLNGYAIVTLFEDFKLGFIPAAISSLGFSKTLYLHLLVIFFWTFIVLISGTCLHIVLNLLRRRPYVLTSKSDLRDWDFHGSVATELNNGEKILNIKSSQIGAIVKSRSWVNYVMSFEFKIPRNISYGQRPNENQLERGFGIIFRARNLGEYFMLKVDKSGFRPHINNNQYWEDLGPTITTDKPPASWIDTWVKAKLVLNKNILEVKIGNFHFQFHLPNYSLVYKDFSNQQQHQEATEIQPTPYVPLFWNNSGTVGFRSAVLEEVQIRKLVIKPYLFEQLELKLKKIKEILKFTNHPS